jgi:hypothetical protein
MTSVWASASWAGRHRSVRAPATNSGGMPTTFVMKCSAAPPGVATPTMSNTGAADAAVETFMRYLATEVAPTASASYAYGRQGR